MTTAVAAFAAAAPCLAEEGSLIVQNAEIDSLVQPAFPSSLSSAGVSEGSVTVMISLDDRGGITDWMPVSATREEFVNAVSKVIDQWTFTPARRKDGPVPSAISVTLIFRHGGVVMSMNGMQMIQALIKGYNDPAENSLVAKYSDLDRLPEPVKVVQPVPSSEIPEADRSGEVVLGFFIDADGHVRMPVLMECRGDIRLAYAAYDALIQWEFEAPVSGGRPVAVRASQKFIFRKSGVSQ